jgi:hypothetical protein
MLLRFTDDYINTIENARLLLGDIHLMLATKEPYMGNSASLDKIYAQSIIISGIIDYLENSDHSNMREDEGLLMCLRSAMDKNICRRPRNKVKKLKNYHIAPPKPTPPNVNPLPNTIPESNVPVTSPWATEPVLDPWSGIAPIGWNDGSEGPGTPVVNPGGIYPVGTTPPPIPPEPPSAGAEPGIAIPNPETWY